MRYADVVAGQVGEVMSETFGMLLFGFFIAFAVGMVIHDYHENL